MNPSDLSQQLRTRLINSGTLDSADLWNITDEQVIESYNTCSDCDSKFCSPMELSEIVESATSAQDFLDGIDEAIEVHKAAELMRLRKRFAKKLPAYIITPALYISEEILDSLPDDPDDPTYDETVASERFTITVIRTSDDETVEQIEYFRNVEEDFAEKFEEFFTQVVEAIPKEEEITLVEPVHTVLEACSCGECDGFLTEYVSTSDYLAQLLEKEEKEKRRKRKKVAVKKGRRPKRH